MIMYDSRTRRIRHGCLKHARKKPIDLSVDNVVIITDEMEPRYSWNLARVISVENAFRCITRRVETLCV